MDKKLTLSLDEKIIEAGKEYARRHQTSISNLLKNYLLALTHEEKLENGSRLQSPINELLGVLDLPKGFDEKAAYRRHQIEKHS